MRARIGLFAATFAAVYGLAVPAHAATFAVTRTADDLSAGSLRWAVAQANGAAGADTITVPAGTFTRTLAQSTNAAVPDVESGDLNVTGDVTIQGAGAASTIIDAAGLDRVFEVRGGAQVTLKGLAVTGGAEVDENVGGGGVLVDAGTLTLDAVTVSRNSSDSGGGGLFAVDAGGQTSSLILKNGSKVSDNTTDYRGGGVELLRGATAAITDAVIAGNTSRDSGGGISHDADGALTISRTAISGNAGGASGGIEAGGPIRISDSSVVDNTSDVAAKNPGGGIFFQSGAQPVAAGAPMIERSLVAGNTAWNGAGIISMNAVTAVNVTISGNHASTYGGGVTSVVQGAFTTTLVNSTVTGNTAPDGGSALARCPATPDSCQTIPGSIEVRNSIVDGTCNLTVTDGGHNLGTSAGCGATVVPELKLGPLAANGGPTKTHELLTGSPAIDAAGAADCPATDQRGLARTASRCDVGAYEVLDTAITSGPSGPTSNASPSFAFDTVPAGQGATFSCWLDAARPVACTSPQALAGLADGEHTFHVQATVGTFA
ncbi:MAG: choice-of-anchor Q domain-containing protein, partial [Solirubrobacteraceae bacterium]